MDILTESERRQVTLNAARERSTPQPHGRPGKIGYIMPSQQGNPGSGESRTLSGDEVQALYAATESMPDELKNSLRGGAKVSSKWDFIKRMSTERNRAWMQYGPELAVFVRACLRDDPGYDSEG